MTGYRLQLPDGWVRARLAGDLDRAVRDVVERTLPRSEFGDSDGAVARQRLRDDLRKAFSAAVDAGAVDMYSHEGEIDGVRLPMSFSVSVAHLGLSVGHLPLETFAEGLAGPGDARVLDLPAGTVIRIERTTWEAARDAGHRADSPATTVQGITDESRRAIAIMDRFVEDNADVEVSQTTVDYVLPIPGEVGTFVLVSLVAPGAADVDARVAHFDVLMAGFGWTR